jgi:hypothetical protein
MAPRFRRPATKFTTQLAQKLRDRVRKNENQPDPEKGKDDKPRDGA